MRNVEREKWGAPPSPLGENKTLLFPGFGNLAKSGGIVLLDYEIK
jgi:hypothetical protein